MTKKHPKPRPDKPGRQFGDPSHSSGQEKKGSRFTSTLFILKSYYYSCCVRVSPGLQESKSVKLCK